MAPRSAGDHFHRRARDPGHPGYRFHQLGVSPATLGGGCDADHRAAPVNS